MRLTLFAFLLFCLFSTHVTAQPESNKKEKPLRKADSAKLRKEIDDVFDHRKENIEKSIRETQTLRAKAAKMNFPILEGAAVNLLGSIYKETGNSKESLAAHYEALKIFEKIQYNYGISMALNNIALVYNLTNKPKDALDYFGKARAIAEKYHLNKPLAIIYGNVLNSYLQLGDLKKALMYGLKTDSIYNKIAFEPEAATNYGNIGAIYFLSKDYVNALKFYNKAIYAGEKTKDETAVGIALVNIGELYETTKAKDPMPFYLKSLTIHEHVGNNPNINYTADRISNYYKAKGDYQQALFYYQKAVKANNAGVNLQTNRAIAELKTKYETEKKDLELVKNRSSILANKAEIQKKNTLLLVSGVSLAFLAGLIFLVYRNASLKQRKLRSDAAYQLKISATETRAQIQEEKLRISQELHDNIGAQLSFINSSIQQLAETGSASEGLLETRDLTQKTMRELRSTVWLINHQEFNLEEFIIKLRDYVKPYHTGKPHITIETHTDENCVLQPVTATNLFRVIQEAINNSIKHAESTLLTVKITGGNNSLQVNITDNGRGYNTQLIPAGYGLKNMQSRIEILKGSYTVKSAETQGTAINITIPV